MTSAQLPLEGNERLLWSGAPRRGILFRPNDLFLIPFSIFWAGFTVFWEVSVLKGDAPVFFALWGIPFVAIGAYMTIGRFFVDAWRRARTTYSLTSDRVVIANGRTTKSLSVRTLSDVTLTERADATGTITFGPTNFVSNMYAGTPWPGMTQTPAFELIPNARSVYTMIQECQRASLSQEGV